MKDNLIGAAIIVPLTWFIVWATAVDSPGDAGLFAMGMAMSGVLVLGLEILIAYLIDKKKRPEKPAQQIISQTNNITQRRKSK